MSRVEVDGSISRMPEVDSVDRRFVSRWSPRSLSGEPLTRDDLAPLFEAARWAPSAFNAQPWRFFYALRGDEYFQDFLALLSEGNQGWACRAGAILVVASRTRLQHNDREAATHSFDTGAAWMSFALQAHQRGLVVHCMQGLDYQRARSYLRLPDVYRIQAMIAAGYPGDPEQLPERLRERERPSPRRPIHEFAFQGRPPAGFE